MEFIYTLLVLLLGLSVGSFLGAFTYRFPKGLNIASGRSFCPHCKAKIVWYDNIPLLSYLLLAGKCRNCGEKISLRYPVIEGAVAIGFLYFFYYSCPTGSLESVKYFSHFYFLFFQFWLQSLSSTWNPKSFRIA